MSVETTKFKRKPIFVDAVQVTEENMKEIADWCQGTIIDPKMGTASFIKVNVHNPQRVRVTKAFVNDWVLYSDFYGYKVFTPGAFTNTFHPLSEEERNEFNKQHKPENVPDGSYGDAR